MGMAPECKRLNLSVMCRNSSEVACVAVSSTSSLGRYIAPPTATAACAARLMGRRFAPAPWLLQSTFIGCEGQSSSPTISLPRRAPVLL